ncbi:GUN4 domain-containing protein [Aerosakkonemataceae cyanobacterium BLCC-F154]|uniref:GUN4 domain-containing protein n=1 Tax=Floridaenema fluviatile BLCC-F154 TaxID=3153640 RepID=A0ABV4YCP3_9CYAN
MTRYKERYLVDESGNRIGVFLDIADYQKILEELEELESIRAFDNAKAADDEVIGFEDDLSSEKGVDYQKLRDLLKAVNWREADLETARVMLKVAGRQKEGWLDEEHIENFPCTDLRTIDRLWVKYSNGKFGFSVQKRIWESVGGKTVEWDYEIAKKFGDRVGWYMNEKDDWKWYTGLTFSLNASSGHLPFAWIGVHGIWSGFSVIDIGLNGLDLCLVSDQGDEGLVWRGWIYLFSRIKTCKL